METAAPRPGSRRQPPPRTVRAAACRQTDIQDWRKSGASRLLGLSGTDSMNWPAPPSSVTRRLVECQRTKHWLWAIAHRHMGRIVNSCPADGTLYLELSDN